MPVKLLSQPSDCNRIGHFTDRNKGPMILSEATFNKVQFENQDTA